MIFDFKKEYRELYLPKVKPVLVDVAKAAYIAVAGEGDPNKENGSYQHALTVLYSLAYTLKMSYKTDYVIEHFYPYVVPPLEGLWWTEKGDFRVDGDKDALHWISLLRLPEFIREEDFNWAKETAAKKKKIDCEKAFIYSFEEGLCAQMMHIGSYDEESKSMELLERFIDEMGYTADHNEKRHHHEIYLSDPRKTSREKLKTVLRVPVKKKK